MIPYTVVYVVEKAGELKFATFFREEADAFVKANGGTIVRFFRG